MFDDDLPEPVVRVTGNACLVSIAMPAKGWTRPQSDADDLTSALAVNVPVGCGAGASTLTALCRAVQADPDRAVREMSPPFTLLWEDRPTGTFRLQTDGLGLAPLYVFDDGDLWAASNRVMTLQAAGVQLHPQPVDWATRLTVGWFPLDRSGFRGVRAASPGWGASLDGVGVVTRTASPLDDWLHPPPEAVAVWCERVRQRMLDDIRCAAGGWSGTPQVSLTGGRDSRAIASCLLALGIPFTAYVHGAASHPDVRVARLLAETAGLPLKHDPAIGRPPDDVAAARRSIELALRWQGGERGAHKHKLFLPGGRRLGAGRVEISGQHGEIGRAKTKVHGLSVAPDDTLVAPYIAAIPDAVRSDLKDDVCDVIREMCGQVDRFDLPPSRRRDFFSLFERSRRRSAAAHASKTGIVLSPFMSPDFIRAGFAVTPELKRGDPFHRHLVDVNFPSWSAVPYEEELPPVAGAAEVGAAWEATIRSRSYDTVVWWDEVGLPILDDAFDSGGFWTQVLDAERLTPGRVSVPDELAMLAMLPSALGVPA